jgi:NAD(P)-dependent dehydrogenase (short-subunit alcohol dehydrogenase family)
MNIQGKRVLITGGSSGGIGLALAHALLSPPSRMPVKDRSMRAWFV